MATIPVTKMKAPRTISGNPPQIMTFPEAASQTFVAGELVYLSGGYVTECSANPTLILGMAADPAHNSTAGAYNVGVYVANSDTIFEISKTNSTGTAAATAVTDVGTGFGVYLDTTNSRVTAYIGAGLNNRLMCLDHSDKDTVGDTGGRLQVQVLGNNRQLFCTS